MCSSQTGLRRLLIHIQKDSGQFGVQEGPSRPKNVRKFELSHFSQEKSENFKLSHFCCINCYRGYGLLQLRKKQYRVKICF